jgi:pyruvate formate lyase activating enzyme
MGIKGFQGTSLLDFPGHIASLVFLGGCNLTCPFCHNPALVIEPEACPDLDVDGIFDDLQERSRFIDGVVFSGGEPTLDGALIDLASRVKALGLKVKLDTNGLAPKVIEQMLDRDLLDYLAIDLKTSLACYPDLHDRPVNGNSLLRSVQIAMGAPVEVELVDESVIHEWGEVISGAPLWAIQQYHPEHALDETMQQTGSMPAQAVEALARLAEGYVERVEVRGL